MPSTSFEEGAKESVTSLIENLRRTVPPLTYPVSLDLTSDLAAKIKLRKTFHLNILKELRAAVTQDTPVSCLSKL